MSTSDIIYLIVTFLSDFQAFRRRIIYSLFHLCKNLANFKRINAMRHDSSAIPLHKHEDYGKYYIMYGPSTVQMMEKIGAVNFSVTDVVEYLTGRKLETCNETNFTDFLTFNSHLLRKGMLEQLAIESYSLHYIANQICRADTAARVIMADDHRRTIGQVIASEGKKPAAVFISSMSSSFQALCAATLVLNKVAIPVILGGIHVSTSPQDADVYIHPHLDHPELISQVIGAGDLSTIKIIVSDIAKACLKKEYHGGVPFEDGAWGSSRVSELPKIKPHFLEKIPLAGSILSRVIETNISTPFLGCPYSCSFCSISSFPKEKRIFTARSPEDFISELSSKQKGGANFKNRFYFISPDNLLMGGEKLHNLLDRMIDSGLTINYAAQISIDVADDEKLLNKLRLSGASHFFLGLESLHIKNLELIGKNVASKIKKEGVSVEEYYSSRIRTIHNHGISVHGAFIFGMPYDYFHSLDDHSGKKIAEFCKRNKIGIQPTCLGNLPGSIDFIKGLNRGEFIYGTPGSMDYFFSLSATDLTEPNKKISDALLNSPLVAFYTLYDTVTSVSSLFHSLKHGVYMMKCAWKSPKSKGMHERKERVIDALAGIGFQLGASTYFELYHELACSTQWVQGIFERLYRQEKNQRVKDIFRDFIQHFV